MYSYSTQCWSKPMEERMGRHKGIFGCVLLTNGLPSLASVSSDHLHTHPTGQQAGDGCPHLHVHVQWIQYTMHRVYSTYSNVYTTELYLRRNWLVLHFFGKNIKFHKKDTLTTHKQHVPYLFPGRVPHAHKTSKRETVEVPSVRHRHHCT